MFKNNIQQKNGVYWASESSNEFSGPYLKVRDKESRVYSDEQVRRLPKPDKNDVHFEEWLLREKSAMRFLSYLKLRRKKTKLLEVGCGNGWFTNLCGCYVQTAVGIDINIQELEQAARVFKVGKVSFAYWDVFSQNPFAQSFDIIVMNAVIQYFPDVDRLLLCLKKYLTPAGEIHILDSPFYNDDEVEKAQYRTKVHYEKMGVPEMAGHYYHHSKNKVEDFDIMYQPSKSKLSRFFNGKDMPFAWYRKLC